jgi:cytochrome P450
MATAPVFESDSLPWEINQAPHRWDVTKPEIYLEDRWHPIFKEMREKAPINKIEGSDFGSYWNITTLKAIQHVEALPDIYSSSFEHGGITLIDDNALEEPIPEDQKIVMPMFIAMDRPKHTEERRVIAPAFTPGEMERMSHDRLDNPLTGSIWFRSS